MKNTLINGYAEILLKKALLICDDTMCIPYSDNITISVSSKMTRNWGRCSRRIDNGKPHYNITVSKRLMESDNETAIMDTIVHEVLHTVEGCMNHGRLWRYYADKVNRRYGMNIKRTTSSAEKGIEPETVTYKYRVTCPKCNYIWKYQRMGKVVSHPNLYRCGTCNETLVRI